MADRKNQHFVPRAHLRPWTVDAGNKAIHLFNLRRGKAIQSAPVKSQCSKDYFYGADGALEEAFGKAEGSYAELVRSSEGLLPHKVDAFLADMRDFTLLQSMRTEYAVESEKALYQKFTNALVDAHPLARKAMTHERAINNVIRRWAAIREQITDLKSVLIKNSTSRMLITSDNPALGTSRLHVQRFQRRVFGVASAGYFFYMPIAPTSGVLYYDGAVYTIPDKVGSVLTLTQTQDVDALNEIQMLGCNENLYFSNWDDVQSIANAWNVAQEHRHQEQFSLNVFVPLEGRHEEYYGPIDANQPIGANRLLQHQRLNITPTKWLSKLKIRQDATCYYNGSAAGIFRQAEANRRGLQAFKRRVSALDLDTGTF